MNFLNKKYTSVHSPSYTQSGSRSFLPPTASVRQSPRLPLGNNNNNCEHHPTQVVRHLCLQCVQLLCAQCIGQHLEMHRDNNVIPKIQSMKHLKVQMQQKLSHLLDVMGNANPALIDIQRNRKRALDRIQDMRRELIRAVDEWVVIMRQHLLTSLGFEEMDKTKHEMTRLHQQVNMLKISLQNGGNPNTIKKIFQIDGQKLQTGYRSMFKNYENLQRKSDFEFSIDWKAVVKSLQSSIVLKNKTDRKEAKEIESPVQSKQESQLQQNQGQGEAQFINK